MKIMKIISLENYYPYIFSLMAIFDSVVRGHVSPSY